MGLHVILFMVPLINKRDNFKMNYIRSYLQITCISCCTVWKTNTTVQTIRGNYIMAVDHKGKKYKSLWGFKPIIIIMLLINKNWNVHVHVSGL